jgi:hypothetical protein
MPVIPPSIGLYVLTVFLKKCKHKLPNVEREREHPKHFKRYYGIATLQYWSNLIGTCLEAHAKPPKTRL